MSLYDLQKRKSTNVLFWTNTEKCPLIKVCFALAEAYLHWHGEIFSDELKVKLASLPLKGARVVVNFQDFTLFSSF